MYGDDWEYANSRLAGTIVRLGEDPVFIHSVAPGMVVDLAKLDDIYNNYKVPAQELNLVPVPLGMCNFEGTISYLSRMPLRRDWKQGLRRENFTSNNVNHAAIPPHELAKVIRGQYPSYVEAMELVAKGLKGVAWTRHWAVSSTGLLHYKWDVVGKKADNKFVLDEPYRHLYEALEEAV